jgi:hypothetical protein
MTAAATRRALVLGASATLTACAREPQADLALLYNPPHNATVRTATRSS